MPRPASRELDIDSDASGMLGAMLGAVVRRPVDTLAAALALSCTVMILVNALALQQGRRPAAGATPAPASELSASPKPKAGADAPKRDELVAQIQTALADRGLYDGDVDGVTGPATVTAIRSFEQAQGISPTGEASEKTLAALLTAPAKKTETKAPAVRAAAPASAPPPAVTSSTAPNPKLMAAQKALAKIGYGPVSIDGKMGVGTRNAIKAFERDRGMPETGELTPPVARALQQMTGAPIQ